MKFFIRLVVLIVITQFFGVQTNYAVTSQKASATDQSAGNTELHFSQKAFLVAEEGAISGSSFRLSETGFRTITPYNPALVLKIQNHLTHLKLINSYKCCTRKLAALWYNGFYIYSLRKILI